MIKKKEKDLYYIFKLINNLILCFPINTLPRPYHTYYNSAIQRSVINNRPISSSGIYYYLKPIPSLIVVFSFGKFIMLKGNAIYISLFFFYFPRLPPG
jgi:hypothetical protein